MTLLVDILLALVFVEIVVAPAFAIYLLIATYRDTRHRS